MEEPATGLTPGSPSENRQSPARRDTDQETTPVGLPEPPLSGTAERPPARNGPAVRESRPGW